MASPPRPLGYVAAMSRTRARRLCAGLALAWVALRPDRALAQAPELPILSDWGKALLVVALLVAGAIAIRRGPGRSG
jgi:hypothetical protein